MKNLSQTFCLFITRTLLFLIVPLISFSQTSYEIDAVNGQSIQTCTGYFYDSGGSGGSYQINENNTVTFCAPAGQVMRVSFQNFDTELNSDFLYVYNGANTSAPQISGSPFSGTNSPGIIISSGSCFTFKFTSNGSTNLSGWFATVVCSYPATAFCGNNLLLNGGFESGLANWTTASGSSGTGTTYAMEGTEYAYIAGATGSLTQAVTATANKNYQLRFYGGTHDPFFDHKVNVKFYNGNTPLAGTQTVNIEYDVDTYVDAQFYSLVFTTPPNTNKIVVEAACTGDYIKLDGFCLSSCTDNLGATASNNSPVCSGSAINLSSTSTGTNTYTWAGPNSFSSTLQNPIISSASASNGGIYTVTVSSGLGCSATATTNVDISSLSLTKVVSACINQPLQDVATVDVTVSWANAPNASDINVTINGKTETIAVSSGANSPQVIRFIVPANGVSNQTINAEWTANSSCTASSTFNAPVSCSSDNLSCEKILYLCGPDKPADGDAFDHGFIQYLVDMGAGMITPAFTKPTGSGYQLYDPMDNSSPLSVILSNYTTIIISPTTEANLSNDLLNDLKGYAGGILMMNYTEVDNLGMTVGNAYYNFQNNAFIDNTNQIDIYNYDNINPTYTRVLTGADYQNSASGSLWFGANNASTTTNGINFNYTASDVMTGVPSTHGSRVYLGYHMNGLYANSQNGGAMPAPVSSYFTPTKHLTLEAKAFFDQAIKNAATSVRVVAVGDNKCEGATVNLSASGVGIDTYSWTGPNSFSSTLQNPTRSNVTSAMSGVYSVTVTSSTGCTASATANVVVNSSPVPTIPNVARCGSGSATLTASGCSGTIKWYGSATGTAILATTNSYTTTLSTTTAFYASCTQSSCESSRANATITINPEAAASISGTENLSCTITTVTRTASGGTTYLWSNGLGTNAVANVSNAGTYTVTVTNANGCTATASTVVTSDVNIAQPTATSSERCGTGTLTLSASGCAGIYNWYASSTSNTSLGTTASFTTPILSETTTYFVACTTGNCVSTRATATATIKTVPSNISASSNSPVLEFNSINLSATSSGGVNYSWTGPNNFTSTAQNPSINNAGELNEGIYVVTFSANNGCSATATTQVIVFNFTDMPNCNTSATVLANSNSPIVSGNTINLSAISTNTIAHGWSGPNGFSSTLQNPSISNANASMAGIYTVTVTADGICGTTATTQVNINCLSNPSASNNSPVCIGNIINLSASGGNSYVWNGPNGFSSTLQNPIISNSVIANQGIYTVTIFGVNNCSATATTTVTINSLPTASISGTENLTCTTTSVTRTASGGGTYLWSNNLGTNAVVNISTSGTYTVTVTNLNGCTATATTVVSQDNSVPTASISGTQNLACANASVTRTASGGGSYQWSGPNLFNSTSAVIVTSVIGTYTVTITNINGCTATATTTVISDNSFPNITLTTTEDTLTCTITSTIITATVLPAGIYTYKWNDNSTASTLEVYDAGIYTVTVTGQNGCTASATIPIVEFNTVTAGIVTNEVSCKGGNDGKITITPLEGKAPFSYKLDSQPFQTNNIYQNLIAGTYIITVKDAGGCTVGIDVVVREPLTNLSLNLTEIVNPKCNGIANGSLKATATGGTQGYEYSIGGTFQSSGIFGSLAAGNYTITAKDAKGCTSTATTSLAQPTPIVPTITATQVTCTVLTGTINVSATGGTGGYSFSKDGANFETNGVFNNLVVGTYTITIRDANNCQVTATTAITTGNVTKPTFTANATSVSCTAGTPNADGKITLTNIVGGITYQYSEGATFNALSAVPVSATNIPNGGIIVSNLANPTGNSKEYTIRVFNANGCFEDVTVSLLKKVCDCKPDICVPFTIQKTKSASE